MTPQEARPIARPLSPHLQVYRWQISNTLSILHRLTGLSLALGALALVSWLLALASGQTAYGQVGSAFATLPGRLLLLVWTLSFFYHLCNGLRHLVWDAGYGFDKAVARRSGVAVVISACVLTVIFWIVALAGVAA